jgi:hypothetical protein
MMRAKIHPAKVRCVAAPLFARAMATRMATTTPIPSTMSPTTKFQTQRTTSLTAVTYYAPILWVAGEDAPCVADRRRIMTKTHDMTR